MSGIINDANKAENEVLKKFIRQGNTKTRLNYGTRNMNSTQTSLEGSWLCKNWSKFSK